MVCYYHNKDLDGFCSGAILKRKFPDAEFIGYDYGQPFEVPIGEEIIMADVSLPMPTMLKVAQASGGKFTWIDHHASAIKDFQEFFKGDAPFTAVLQDGIAACEITWKWCFPLEPMPAAIELLGEYDTWRNKDRTRWNDFIMPFQYGMRMLCNSLDSFPMAFIHKVNGSNFEDIIYDTIRTGKSILQYQRQQSEMACMMAAFEYEFENLRAICLNTSDKNSNTFASVYDESKHDIMMPFVWNGKTQSWSFSIYTTKDDVDCSALAKAMHGGGHKKAAGFHVKDIKDIFPFM